VVTTVTVWEHKPLTGRKSWPSVEVTVAVHGAMPIGEFGGLLMEVVMSKLVLPFCGDVGAVGELVLLKVGLELADCESGVEIVGLS
jgi:hypothetical protein